MIASASTPLDGGDGVEHRRLHLDAEVAEALPAGRRVVVGVVEQPAGDDRADVHRRPGSRLRRDRGLDQRRTWPSARSPATPA